MNIKSITYIISLVILIIGIVQLQNIKPIENRTITAIEQLNK